MDKIRLIKPEDSLEELTDLIHKAYKQLAELGFKYWGTHQTIEDTKKRISGGECYIQIKNNTIISTVVLNDPKNRNYHSCYKKKNTTTFGQFAVDPKCQKQGIGSDMMDFVEKRAYELGFEEIACDTAEGATHLVNMYIKRGYRIVDKASWKYANYSSVILSKKLNVKE